MITHQNHHKTMELHTDIPLDHIMTSSSHYANTWAALWCFDETYVVA